MNDMIDIRFADLEADAERAKRAATRAAMLERRVSELERQVSLLIQVLSTNGVPDLHCINLEAKS